MKSVARNEQKQHCIGSSIAMRIVISIDPSHIYQRQQDDICLKMGKSCACMEQFYKFLSSKMGKQLNTPIYTFSDLKRLGYNAESELGSSRV